MRVQRLGAYMTAAVAAVAIGAPAAHARPAADDVIVVFERGAGAGERDQARQAAGVSLERTLARRDFQLVRVEGGRSTSGAIAELRADPRVRLAVRDGYDRPHAVPNDPRFEEQWGLRNRGVAPGVRDFPNPLPGADIDAVSAWDRATGSPGTVLAVLDSGYRFNHEDLAGVVWANDDPIGGGDQDRNGYADDQRGWDFVGPDSAVAYAGDNDPTDDNLATGGHGVHVAGTAGAAGNNGKGVTGVAQNARIMPLRVCSPAAGSAQTRCLQSAQVAAINYAGANGARVANMSLGGAMRNQAVVNALASNPRTLFVVSAGNEGADNARTPKYPCDYNPAADASPAVSGAVDNVLCVAATDQADALAGFSNYGAGTVDLGAPGTEILSTHLRSDYAYLSGTSMAAPHVTGAAGLLFSLAPSASVTEVRNALLASVDPLPSLRGKTVTGGRLDSARALDSLVPQGGPSGASDPGSPAVQGGGTSAGGGGPAASSDPGTPAATFGIRGLARSLRLDRAGRGAITVTGSPGLSGSVSLATARPVAVAAGRPRKRFLTLARQRFAIPSAGRRAVRFRVTGRNLRTLSKAGRLSVKVVVAVSGRKVARTITLRPARAGL